MMEQIAVPVGPASIMHSSRSYLPFRADRGAAGIRPNSCFKWISPHAHPVGVVSKSFFREVLMILSQLPGRPGINFGRIAKALVIPALAVFLIPTPAAAYIDPVSGSVLLQIISAGILAGAVTIGRTRAWLASLFRRATGRANTDAE
jgi:hypothetical protein